MPNLVVITFDNEQEADQVRSALEKAGREKQISLDDSAVVIKDRMGSIRVENQVDRGVKVGAIGGGLVGLLVGFLVGGPIVSAALGMVAGAMGGDLADLGIDQRFINDVGDSLEPGSSALFVLVQEADPEAVRQALAPFGGQVYYTTLPAEAEEDLRRLLSEKRTP